MFLEGLQFQNHQQTISDPHLKEVHSHGSRSHRGVTNTVQATVKWFLGFSHIHLFFFREWERT